MSAILQPFEIRSVNITGWTKTGFADKPSVRQALEWIKGLGANYAVIDWGVNFNDNGTIVGASDSSPSHPIWEDILYVVQYAKSLGLSVALKPHTVLPDSVDNRNSSNTSLDSFLVENFFPDWTEYIEQLSIFAKQNSVDLLVIGTEFEVVDSVERPRWETLIQTVRSKFDGLVTYDAHYPLDEVVFWDLLDFIAVSLYIPLGPDDFASRDVLARSLLESPYGNDRYYTIGQLYALHKEYEKDIVALEGGYQSFLGGLGGENGNMGGYADAFPKERSDDTQYNGLDAYLFGLQKYGGDWFTGVSLWQVNPVHIERGLSEIYSTLTFSFIGKKSEVLVQEYFSGQRNAYGPHTVNLDGNIKFGGIFNNTFVVSNEIPSEIELKIEYTSRIVEGEVNPITVFVDGELYGSFSNGASQSSYVDSRGYNWTNSDFATLSIPKDFQRIEVKGSTTSEDAGSYIHSYKIAGVNEDVTLLITNGVNNQSVYFESVTVFDSTNYEAYQESSKSGSTLLQGGEFIDTIVFDSQRENFDISVANEDSLTIFDKASEFFPYIIGDNIERLQFDDTNIALDLDGHAGEAVKTLGAFLGASGITPENVGLVLNLLDGGLSYEGLLAEANAVVFGADPDGATMVRHFYTALTGEEAPADVINQYGGMVDNGELSRVELAKLVADYEVNLTNIDLVGLSTTGVEYLLG